MAQTQRPNGSPGGRHELAVAVQQREGHHSLQHIRHGKQVLATALRIQEEQQAHGCVGGHEPGCGWPTRLYGHKAPGQQGSRATIQGSRASVTDPK